MAFDVEAFKAWLLKEHGITTCEGMDSTSLYNLVHYYRKENRNGSR